VLQRMAPVTTTARRAQRFSLGHVVGEPSSPADTAKSASTLVFQGIKQIHSRSC
jgi:hypothetical protein